MTLIRSNSVKWPISDKYLNGISNTDFHAFLRQRLNRFTGSIEEGGVSKKKHKHILILDDQSICTIKNETKQYGLSRTNKDNDSKSTIEGLSFRKRKTKFYDVHFLFLFVF
jgi:hypothetical protein